MLLPNVGNICNYLWLLSKHLLLNSALTKTPIQKTKQATIRMIVTQSNSRKDTICMTIKMKRFILKLAGHSSYFKPSSQEKHHLIKLSSI